MIIRLAKIAFCLLGVTLMLGACDDGPKFSDTPSLEWQDYEIIDSTGNRRYFIITASFTDGDGDVGRDDNSVDCEDDYQAYIDDHDLYIYYFEKVNGVFREVLPADSCQTFHSVLPNLTPEGQNKTLEGDIRYTFSYLGLPRNPGVDSIQFDLVLQDRAGHRSPITSSPTIGLSE